MIKKIKKSDYNNINSMFPYLQFEELFPSGDTPFEEVHVKQEVVDYYHNFAVSAYPDWETREKSTCYSFPVILNMRKNKEIEDKWNIYKKFEFQFLSFYSSLLKYGIFIIFWDDDFVKITSEKELHSFVKVDIREIKFHRFIIPDLGVMISGNFDLTHIIHASKKHYKKDAFEKIVKDAGLFILT